jgi:hypothetical protein
VGEGEDAVRLLDRGLHLPGLRQRHRQRLVADDVDSRLEEGVGRAGVDVVRCDDRNRLDPVRPLGLGLRHALVIVVDAVLGESQRLARAARALSGVDDSVPATSSYWSSMREAMRWTAPMKAPSPPPTMPSLILPPFLASLRPSMAIGFLPSLQSERALDC